MITTALAALILSPWLPYPDPNYPDPNNLAPTYITNADGTRMQCTPTASFCYSDSSGLPSYLQGG